MSCDSSSRPSPTPPVTPAAEHAATTQGYNGFDGGGDNALNGGGGELDLLPGQEAGPSEQQSMIDYGQHNICAWGPVIQQIVVPVAGTDPITVNRLSSPDPFTPTYQLPDGEIVTTNTPLPVLLAPGYTPAEPPVVAWTEPESGELVHLYDGWIQVYFKREATQAQIEQVIAQNNLQVIMSWYEPDDEAGPGNSMAWFEFQYSPQHFANFSVAYAFFNAHPLVSLACPDTTDEVHTDYGQPLGSLVHWPTDKFADSSFPFPGCSTIEAYWVSQYSFIPLGPEAGGSFSSQVVVVIDNGVYRAHKDFITGLSENPGPGPSLGIKGKISWIGVDVSDREIWIGTKQKLRGEPEFISTNEKRLGLVSHGTMMAGMISAGTRNPSTGSGTLGTGTASLAPSALILPVRLKVTNTEKISASSPVKAIRAIRFNFGHTKWIEKVRVVNMSFSADGMFRWWPSQDIKYNIGRDLIFNDRLYIGSAGNDGKHTLQYPAAHDNVLGVTGALAWRQTEHPLNFTYTVHEDSNYWGIVYPPENSAYAVSGIYQFVEPDAQLLPVPPGNNNYDIIYDSARYNLAGGTSESTAQISALAFLLYDAKARQTGNPLASSWQNVRYRITHTKQPDITFNNDPNHKIAGVADFGNALCGW
jgi:hypothetical protein